MELPDPRNVSHTDSVAKTQRADAQVAWTRLLDHVGAFCDAWEGAEMPPDLRDFAPNEPTELRRLAVIELVKVDLEQRWQRDLAPWRIEDYLIEFPELTEADGGIPCELIYEEYHVRRQCGEDLTPDEFLDRFPSQVTRLNRLFGVDDPESTSVFSGVVAQPVDVGDSIDDFDLLTKLGKGAFATVYLARQRSLQRLVALKVSSAKSHEAQTLAQLDHPHIVRVYDQRIIAERGLRLLYMQYVAGAALNDLLDALEGVPAQEWSGRALLRALDAELLAHGEAAQHESMLRRRLEEATWPEVVCWLGVQLASALDYAHEQGVLHRDLKPANVLLDATGAAKIVDFNISFCSKLAGATPAAYFGGSLAYMSPEQLEACNPDHDRDPSSLDGRSDVYSVGVVLWEMLAGQRPFQDDMAGSSWPRTVAAAVTRRQAVPDTRPLSKLPFRETESLVEVLVGCLQPYPEQRIHSAGEVARQLRLCLEPEAQRLLRPRDSVWQRFAQRFPLLLLLTLLLLPNAFAAVFNFAYNHEEIVKRLQDAENVFFVTQLIINGIAFPLGLLIAGWVAWPLARALRSNFQTGTDLGQLRRICLMIGHWGAVLGVIEWTVCGVIYPIAMHVAGIPLTTHIYTHFVASLALCGTIAATYPFFFLTYLAVKHYYPRLIRHGPVPWTELKVLRRVHRLSWMYLALAAALPLLGVTVLVVFEGPQNRLALGVLSAGGLAGFVGVFFLARALQDVLTVLADYVELSNQPNSLGAENLRHRTR